MALSALLTDPPATRAALTLLAPKFTGLSVNPRVTKEYFFFLAWKFPYYWGQVALTWHQRLNCWSDVYEIRCIWIQKCSSSSFWTTGSVTLLKDTSDLAKVQCISSLRKYEFRENWFGEKHTLLNVVTEFRPIFCIPCTIGTKFGTDMFTKYW